MESTDQKAMESIDQKEMLKVTRFSTEASKLKVQTSNIETEKLKSVNTDDKGTGNMETIMPVNDIQYDLLKSVNKKKEIWRFGVIIDDMWSVYKGDVEDHIDMLIRDIKGNTIQVTILDSKLETWKPILSEGKTYYMRNFKVYDNDSLFKMSPHKFRLNFVGATRVDPIDIPGMTITAFNFKEFSEILSGKFDPKLLVDVIGFVECVKKCVTASSSKKGNVSFTLKNLRDNMIDCTLWDGLSEQFLNFYQQQTDSGPVVIIIKHSRIKEPQGVYPLQLTNVWNGTKLLFDPNLPEIKSFVSCLPADVAVPTQHLGSSYSTQAFTQASAGSSYSSDENFIKQARVLTLGAMKKLKADTYCVTVATTSHIKVSNQGWYFHGCQDCSCKADGTVHPYICKKGHKTNHDIIRYRLDVEVYDSDDTAKFVFWDNTLEEILGMSAATLLEKQKQIGLGDPQEYPPQLDDMMERKFAFRVKWTTGWGGQATVLNYKDSKELVDKVSEQLPAAESSSKSIPPNQDQVVAIEDSPPKQTFSQTDIDKFSSLDDSILSTPNVPSKVDTDTSASSQKTPAKRGATKNAAVDHTNLEAQFSSTRSGKHVKKEKI